MSIALFNCIIDSEIKDEFFESMDLHHDDSKNHLIAYYETFGYKNFGVSDSVHGGSKWYDMVLKFK